MVGGVAGGTVLLVNPRTKANDRVVNGYPNFGLLSLASQVPAAFQTRLMDAQFYTAQHISSAIKESDIVGVTVRMDNCAHAKELVAEANENGKRVVLGGPHATFMSREILVDEKWPVEGIFIGYSDVSFRLWLGGKDIKEIEGSAFLHNGDYRLTAQPILDPNKIAPPRFELLGDELQQFLQISKQQFPQGVEKLDYYTYNFCVYANSQKSRCSFCSVPRGMEIGGKKILTKYKSAESIWSELKAVGERFGVMFFYLLDDSITGNRKWLRDFLEARPKNFAPSFYCYGTGGELSDSKTVAILKELNVNLIQVGNESGDDEILRKYCCGKTSSEKNLEAVANLDRVGIGVFSNFIIGFENETEESIRNTVELAKRTAQFGQTKYVEVGPMIPRSGSRVFYQLINHPKLKAKYAGKVVFDANELLVDWVENFTNVSVGTIQKAIDEISRQFGTAMRRSI